MTKRAPSAGPAVAVIEFARACEAGSQKPLDVLTAAGLHRCTWGRWMAGVGPNLHSLEMAWAELRRRERIAA